MSENYHLFTDNLLCIKVDLVIFLKTYWRYKGRWKIQRFLRSIFKAIFQTLNDYPTLYFAVCPKCWGQNPDKNCYLEKVSQVFGRPWQFQLIV